MLGLELEDCFTNQNCLDFLSVVMTSRRKRGSVYVARLIKMGRHLIECFSGHMCDLWVSCLRVMHSTHLSMHSLGADHDIF